MTVSVYTLRIREEPDDTEGTEVRIVAASLTEAVVRAEMRFGASRILGVEQVETPPEGAAGDTGADVPAAPIEDADFIVAQAPEPLPGVADDAPPDARAAAAALAYVHPPASDARAPAAFVADDDPAVRPDFPPPQDDAAIDPFEGRWRPAVLLGAGALVGLFAFVAWANFGAAPRDRFITADAPVASTQPGLPIEGEAPPGGVIQAAGVSLRPGRAGEDLGEVVGQVVSHFPDEERGSAEIVYDDGDIDDGAVEAIGAAVGEIFSQWPQDEPAPAPPVLHPPREPTWPRGEPQPMPPPPPAALLQRWYIEVQRADRVTETLSVNATSAEHARAMVYDRPDHPVIVNGPSTELTW